MSWKDYLFDQERARLAELANERTANKAECRRIYDRCRKRMPPKSVESRIYPEPPKRGVTETRTKLGKTDV